MLLLYTDGLVEHPSRPLHEGMEALARVLPAHSHEPASTLAASLVHHLREGTHSDDICLLALRV